MDRRQVLGARCLRAGVLFLGRQARARRGQDEELQRREGPHDAAPGGQDDHREGSRQALAAATMIELVIPQRRRDLGGFEVGRVLPYAGGRMVGPFVFFDHMGPSDFPAGLPRSVDVRPHPHIGLSTITYLFDGEIMHRDSVGSQQPIRAGEVNWMTAGRGITHSERFERARLHGDRLHGIQAWVALPADQEETDPSFSHHAMDDQPLVSEGGATARLVAGRVFGMQAKVRTHSPMFYLHWALEAGAAAELPGEYAERAVYVATGAI